MYFDITVLVKVKKTGINNKASWVSSLVLFIVGNWYPKIQQTFQSTNEQKTFDNKATSFKQHNEVDLSIGCWWIKLSHGGGYMVNQG